ncbi:MAG: DUF1080 domain-containing protein [Chitinophagaceae bacterium]
MPLQRYCFFLFLLVFISCKQPVNPDAAKQDWEQLFNGKDLTGWDIKIAGHDLNDNFNDNFSVKDGAIKVDYSKFKKFDNAFGHLYYKKPFSYYIIRTEYRFTGQQLEGGPSYAYLNSGVMLHSQSAASVTKNQWFPVSLELQLLASDEKEKRHNGNLCTPGTEVSMHNEPVAAHCIDSKSKNSFLNEWVTAEAIVYGDSLIHHLINGDTVLTYEKTKVGGGFVNSGMTWTSGGFAADSLDWIKKDGTPLRSGFIALQAESHPVEFRKVELLNLEGCMDPKATNYKTYFVKADNTQCRYK